MHRFAAISTVVVCLLLFASESKAFAPQPVIIGASKKTFPTCKTTNSLALQRQLRQHRTLQITKIYCSADTRTVQVFDGDDGVGAYIRKRVEEIAKDAIANTGHFTMSIGSGTTVKPLKGLKDSGIDFNHAHIFFGNERVEGDTAFKCYQGSQEFVTACDIPESQVYRVPGSDANQAAEDYEKLIKFLVKGGIMSVCQRTGLPALDLVLLGSGADGHTASLYPGSPQVLISPSKRLVVPAFGKGGVTITLDLIQSAKNVIISAGKKDQANMVAEALGSTSSSLPAGMIMASPSTKVEWLLTKESVALLKK